MIFFLSNFSLVIIIFPKGELMIGSVKNDSIIPDNLYEMMSSISLINHIEENELVMEK